MHYWPFVWGIHRSPVNSPHKGQWSGPLMFSVICAWTNGWVNNWDTRELRHHHAHYDVIVMNNIFTGQMATGEMIHEISSGYMTFTELTHCPPSRCGCEFKCLMFIHNLVIDILNISSGIVLRWLPQDPTDYKSTLGLSRWRQQAIIPEPMLTKNHDAVTRPQWVRPALFCEKYP